MKKIFLVDDEIVVREGIRKCIDWKKAGFEYCGDASDGEMALPLIDKYRPDIIITDIKMPFMDGLELSRILKDKMPSVKIIILSGHDEFEYARKAMQIQINEYCLKPLSSIDLLVILEKVSSQIDQEEMERKRFSDLEDQALQSISYSKDKYKLDLCEGKYSTAEAISQGEYLGIDIIANVYSTILLEHDRKEIDFVESFINQYPNINVSRNSKERIFIMKGESREELELQVSMIRKYLVDIAKEHPEYGLYFFIGEVHERIQGIQISFAEAEKEKVKHIYSRHNIEFDEKVELQQFDRKDLTDFLKVGNKGSILDFCLSYSTYLKDLKVHNPFYFYYFLMDFTTTIKLYIKEVDKDSITILHEIKVLESRVRSINDYDQVVTYMKEMLNIIFEAREQSISKFSRVIEKTKDYIVRHHSDSQLSLQNVAKQVNISPSYLSHIFSQETGQTIIEYLTMIRIDRAKELLKTTNDKTYEIAYKVGYSDSHYFCHLFKKITGMTTKSFKNQDQKASL
ncbi:response regulator transcription factor [Salipaludibacillus sp. HK11]|uniref:response regulator transcription factor n=1 Tax=Salipaludibacillus sp. HK11 TaxID=3394320 RepID=UPI0039FCEF8C